jgi:hypothetical protein
MFEPPLEPQKNISFSWETGKYFDLWSIAHFMSGVCIGFFLLYADIPTTLAWIIAFSIGVFWEIFESVIHIIEPSITAILSDIVFSMIGFMIIYHFVHLPRDAYIAFGINSVLIFLSICLFGWRNYVYRQRLAQSRVQAHLEAQESQKGGI